MYPKKLLYELGNTSFPDHLSHSLAANLSLALASYKISLNELSCQYVRAPLSLLKQLKSLSLWEVDKVLLSESSVGILIRNVGGLPGTCSGDPLLPRTKLPWQFAEEEWERGLWKL